jgi:hypothetical protein
MVQRLFISQILHTSQESLGRKGSAFEWNSIQRFSTMFKNSGKVLLHPKAQSVEPCPKEFKQNVLINDKVSTKLLTILLS